MGWYNMHVCKYPTSFCVIADGSGIKMRVCKVKEAHGGELIRRCRSPDYARREVGIDIGGGFYVEGFLGEEACD